MKRGILGWALALACASTAITGCELLHREQRPRAIDEPKSEPEEGAAMKGAAVKGESESPSSFFKSTRLRGALSSEAADIERSLGVP